VTVGAGVVVETVDRAALPEPQVGNGAGEPEEVLTVAHPVATAARTPRVMIDRFIVYIFAAGGRNDPGLQRTFRNFIPRGGRQNPESRRTPGRDSVAMNHLR